MGNMLGGGAPPNNNGGGFLQNLLGGLPDPLGLGKILGVTGQPQQQQPMGQPQPSMGAPPPVNFAPQMGPQSGVSAGAPSAFQYSPMGPNGFKVGGG